MRRNYQTLNLDSMRDSSTYHHTAEQCVLRCRYRDDEGQSASKVGKKMHMSAIVRSIYTLTAF